MGSEIPLALQTVYADLLDRCSSAAFGEAFADDGVFTPKTVRGRRYWYFQVGKGNERRQQYVGPETHELLERIARHRDKRDDERDRRALVSTLVRSARLPRPAPQIGNIVAALATAGVFRLRGVLIGTVAFQTYPAMLGLRLAGAPVQTQDIDIAQFSDVSVAVRDSTPAMLGLLQKVDASFRAIPHLHDARRVATYASANGIRVDFLTPNRGPDTDAPAALPALGTDAQQLRFLDFLIREPESAVILHGSGIYVLVPAPQRFAVHKLILARRRPEGAAKVGKDLHQAGILLEALTRKRPQEVRDAWQEAYGRGKAWRQLIGEGLGLLDPRVRDQTLRCVGAPRSIVPGLDLRFAAPPARYNAARDVVTFWGDAGEAPVRCAVSGEALEDHFGPNGADRAGRLTKFRENRATIEEMVRTKYLTWPVEEPGSVLLKTADVQKLLREFAGY